MDDFRIIEATTDGERAACFAIRTEVFCGEQRVSRDIEFDGLDDRCRHYLATADGVAIGTARARPLGNGAVKFERIAVLRDRRRGGVGRALMDRALADARRGGHTTAILHAQAHAGTFYAGLGFVQEGDGFLEADIPHIRMSRKL